MVIKTAYNFVDFNLGIEISSKIGRVLEVVLRGRGQMTCLGEGRICLGN